MASSLWRFGITLTLLGFVCTAPATVEAQPPPSFLTQWGSYGSGDGQFSNPEGVATDAAGNVYVADSFNHRIQKFTGNGVFLTKWGSNGSDNGQFIRPFGVATDAAGNVYVVDYGNNRIQKFTGTGTYLTQWQGNGNEGFYGPLFLATDAAGNVFVNDQGNRRIVKFTGGGTYITQWPCVDSLGNPFNANGIAIDANGNAYVADTSNDLIWKFTSSGGYLTKWGSSGTGDGQFDIPFGVATDVAGDVYVGDTGSGERIQKFTNTGTYLTQWGSFGTAPGEFYNPRGVATGAGGVIYVADEFHRIQKFGPSAVSVSPPGEDGVPLRLAISPNPSRTSADMTFALPTASRARLEIFDMQGRRVALALDSELAAGPHQATWDGHTQSGRTAAAGIYFARMSAGDGSVVRRFALLR